MSCSWSLNGGPIAELLSIIDRHRIISITLMATSCDFRPMNLAYNGLPEENNSLPRTKDIYLNWMKKFLDNPPQNEVDHVNLRVEGWHILSGNKVPFEEERYRELHQEFINRANHPTSHVNHIHVCRVSEKIVKEIPSQVTVPTLIIHGSEDPIFPPNHGKALATHIKHSKYIPVDGMGHVPCAYFYELIINSIKFIKEDCQSLFQEMLPDH